MGESVLAKWARRATAAFALVGVGSVSLFLLAPDKVTTVRDSLAALGSKSGYKIPDSSSVQAPHSDAEVRALKSFSKAFVNIAKSARPALVFIATSKTVSVRQGFPGFPDDFFLPFFGPQGRGGGGGGQQRQQQQGAGSGFIVDLRSGYVITNNHVIDGADDIQVATFNDRKFKAKVLGADKSTDVAVLKVEDLASESALRQVGLADSEGVEVGDWVAALGAPFQLPQTLTVGIVSALGRNRIISDGTSIEDFIQTDAAINPGNSGGPLLNLEGRVVGMNTAIYSGSSGTSAGIGFAVPANMVRQVAEMIINEGKVTRGYLGIMMRDLDLKPETLKQLKVPDGSGTLIQEVMAGSPADKAGLKPGDVIIAMNGQSLQNLNQLRARIAFTKPGTEVKLSVLRAGKRSEVNVKIGSQSDAAAAQSKPVRRGGASTPEEETLKNVDELGLSLRSLNAETRRQLGLKGNSGVLVAAVEEDSPAAMAQLRRGDVIVEVNGNGVRSPRDVEAAIKTELDRNKDLLLLIERDKQQVLAVSRLSR